MPGITGQGTTFNLPNFVGELFNASPEDTPFLSAIGGLTGGREATATEFEWQGFDLRDPSQRTRVEGADAPTGENRVRYNAGNVVEIHQEAVRVSYTKLAATGAHSGANIAGSNPVMNEAAWQISNELKQMGRDIEFSFVRDKYNKPSDNLTARRTRGIMQATTTNVKSLAGADQAFTHVGSTDVITANAHGYANGDQVCVKSLTTAVPLVEDKVYYVRDVTTNTFKLAATSGGAAIDFAADGSGTVYKLSALTEAALVDVMQLAWENGGIQEQSTATLMCGAGQKRRLTKIFITDKGYEEQTRNVAGVSLQTIETDFGRVNLMLSRFMTPQQVQICSMEECAPRLLNIPGKGFLFVEELAKTGASDNSQLYGEVGLEYGNEKKHARIDGLAV